MQKSKQEVTIIVSLATNGGNSSKRIHSHKCKPKLRFFYLFESIIFSVALPGAVAQLVERPLCVLKVRSPAESYQIFYK